MLISRCSINCYQVFFYLEHLIIDYNLQTGTASLTHRTGERKSSSNPVCESKDDESTSPATQTHLELGALFCDSGGSNANGSYLLMLLFPVHIATSLGALRRPPLLIKTLFIQNKNLKLDFLVVFSKILSFELSASFWCLFWIICAAF